MSKILVIQHVPFEGLGKLDAWFQLRALTPRIVRFFEEETALPCIDDYEGLVILGGPMGVNEVEQYPWLTKELDYLRAVLERGKKIPILGICLGAQILSHLLGGEVVSNEEKEIGWYPVTLYEEARRESALFAKWPKELVVFHWHQDTFSIPPGAKALGESAACSNQGFFFPNFEERPIVGLQFHLEMTHEISQRLVTSCHEDLLPPAPYIASKEQILSGFAPYAQAQTHLFSFLDAWLQVS